MSSNYLTIKYTASTIKDFFSTDGPETNMSAYQIILVRTVASALVVIIICAIVIANWNIWLSSKEYIPQLQTAGVFYGIGAVSLVINVMHLYKMSWIYQLYSLAIFLCEFIFTLLLSWIFAVASLVALIAKPSDLFEFGLGSIFSLTLVKKSIIFYEIIYNTPSGDLDRSIEIK